MDPKRWRLVESLFHAALEMPPGRRRAFLRQECSGDAELEHEVLSLLGSREKADRFLESPAIEVAARAITELNLAGQTISHYQVLEKLGVGGMGVVYKAVDTKLNRPVALKFLPPQMHDSLEMKRLLRQEALAASALDHPNIVVIHDVAEAPSGELFIAMAFHEGLTLREKIEREDPGHTGLAVAESLQIARHVASGLARAHDFGIFHRDIKPANIIVAKDGVTRIIDFGLAKTSAAAATLDGSSKGTPLYMSPEQASGGRVDYRTDLWSLGAVIYEMLSGKPPYPGEQPSQVIYAILHNPVPRLREARPDLPPEIDLIVSKALHKNPVERYQRASDLVRDLSVALAALETPLHTLAIFRPVFVIAAMAAILLLAGGAFWYYQRSEKRHWAREQAIPEIVRLTAEKRPVAALLLARQARQYLPADPRVAQLEDGLVTPVSVRSSPPGALVEIKDYLSPREPWVALGTTPLQNAKVPSGYLRWRVTKPGMAEYNGAPVTAGMFGPLHELNFSLSAANSLPEGMVPVPAGQYRDMIWSIGDVGPYELPLFYIDRTEVTNRQYQAFVDQGGYQKREYWKEKFLREGRELTWEQAMELFRDSSGRPGPSTWVAGRYPIGQDEYPVGGVSWYEASAYAEFAGKSLPVLAQWFLAAPSPIAKYVTRQSNFSVSGPAPAGKYNGVGPWGTLDMAGNVAEWCHNEGGPNSRFSLGGAWNTSSSEYFEPGVQPPFNRSPNSGFRCVRNMAVLPVQAAAPIHPLIRDFSKVKPASDEVYRVYKAMYAYDHTPLNAKVESVVEDSPDWRKEKIAFDAAYGNERMTAYLFVPARVHPPYQTVVFFPSSRATGIPSSQALGDMNFIDYVIQSGRAVLYPVYKGTYERPGPENLAITTAGREALIQQSKDIGRSIDYLETRKDIDRNKIGYLGESLGGALGVIFAAVEERFKAAIFLDGGFYGEKMLPGTDQADFAPRLKVPTLLISGRYDWIFLSKDALLNLIGAPASDKRVVTFETAHDVSEQRADLVREVVAWLDKYFGKVS